MKKQKTIDEQIISFNFTYSCVEYDYDISNCTGRCDDYCRCTVIINSKITSVDVSNFSNHLIKENDANQITAYCIDRIVRCSGLTDESNYYIEVSQGYYGQEIDRIEPNDKCINYICVNLKQLLSIQDDFEQLKFTLELEYGYLIDDLKNNNYLPSIIKVKPDDLLFGSQNTFLKINKDIKDVYKNHSLPRALCFKENDKYRVLDGNSRVMSAIKNKLKKIEIIELVKC